MSKGFLLYQKSSIKSFTLIELIVVIIIVGILAAMGISQYTKVVEKARGAEARMIIGNMRDLAYQYYLENGTITGITFADLNIGTNSGQIPAICAPTYYFSYQGGNNDSGAVIRLWGVRCASGGKTPQNANGNWIYLQSDFSTGTNVWYPSSPGVY